MKITKTHTLMAIIGLLTILFIVGQIMQFDVLSNSARSLVLPFATALYFIKVKKRSFYFTAFLLIFSISELIGLFVFMISKSVMFYITNSLYIIGYIFLILEVLTHIKESPDYKGFFTKYAIHMAVLIMFAVYLVILLGEIMKPHLNRMEYTVSMVFATAIMTLLTVSLLNFICNDNKKTLLLFLASMCIVFSEIVQIAYYYLSQSYALSVIYSLLLVVAFYLFYKHGFLKKDANRNLNLFKP